MSEAQRFKAKNVLIVDDEQMMRSVLKAIVVEMGLRVVGEAHSGNEVMSSIKSQKPDLVFLDINLPGISGLDLLQNIHSDFPEIKVIMISGDSTRAHVKAALESGAIDFITKPFSPLQVLQKLQGRIEVEQDTE